MISSDGVKRYAEAMRAAKPVYIWGADGEVMTKEFFALLKKRYGEEHYGKIDLSEIEGRFGADCSGFLTKISGQNKTAESYYQSCKIKGPAVTMDLSRVCLVFRKEGIKITHVAIYTGDGFLTEMWNGCEKRKWKASEWTYFGEPDWITQTKPPIKAGDTVKIPEALLGYQNASDAEKKKNAKTSLTPGNYYVYKVYKNATNLTKKRGVPGSWVIL